MKEILEHILTIYARVTEFESDPFSESFSDT
jgi:hypothetical protein